MTFLEKDQNGPKTWNDEMQVTNRYTFGVAGERFFREIKEEARIFGTRCKNCQRTYVPASIFCERCLDELDDWVDVGITGEIETFTDLYVNYDGTHRSEPETVAFIKFGDGGIIHRLISPDSEEIEIGMSAKAIFKPKAEREGSILDIHHFELLAS